MRPAKCRLCGAQEWGHVCDPALKPNPAPPPVRIQALPPPRKPAKAPAKSKRKGVKRKPGTFDRVAYQREYMRKWRANRKRNIT